MIIKQLNNGALLFFAVIILALGFQWFTSKNYRASKNEVLMEINEPQAFLSLAQFYEIFVNDKLDDYVLIDIRQESYFDAGHIENSVNIPIDDLLSKSHKRLFKKKLPKIIIAGSDPDALAALFFLKGKNYNNVFILRGGYKKAVKYATENFDPAFAFYSEDKAKYDYPRFMDVAAPSEEEIESIIPDVPIETITVEGGC